MSRLKNILAGAVIAGGLALAVTTFNLPHLCRETVTATVKDKEVKRYNDKDRYLIFTDKGVFENTDSWIELKFNSSDLYGKLERGKSYQLRAYGWRIPFLSKYRNITQVNALRATPLG